MKITIIQKHAKSSDEILKCDGSSTKETIHMIMVPPFLVYVTGELTLSTSIEEFSFLLLLVFASFPLNKPEWSTNKYNT